MKYILIFLIFVLGIFVFGCSSKPQVCFENTCFEAELAITPSEQQFGLMNRLELPKDKGMLFIYKTSNVRKFWMKNTLIPLDIIWLDENNQVVYISKNTPPCEITLCPSYGPDFPTYNVFEINAGLSDEFGIINGSKATITSATN